VSSSRPTGNGNSVLSIPLLRSRRRVGGGDLWRMRAAAIMLGGAERIRLTFNSGLARRIALKRRIFFAFRVCWWVHPNIKIGLGHTGRRLYEKNLDVGLTVVGFLRSSDGLQAFTWETPRTECSMTTTHDHGQKKHRCR